MAHDDSSRASLEIARVAVEEHLISRACSDAAFRAALMNDPKGVIARETGIVLTEGVSVEVHAETPAKLHLVLPLALIAQDELPDEALDRIAGGTSVPLGEVVTPSIMGAKVTGKGHK